MQPDPNRLAGPQQPDGVVQPQPTPVTWITQSIHLPTRQTLVVIQIATVTGNTTVFMDPQQAKAVAAQIEREASQAQTGLILPNG